MRDLLAFGQSQRQQGPSPLLRTIVGGVLRRTRLSQRRTLADVAASARISMQYLSELERGRKEASSEILAALCAALQIDLSELLAAVGHDLLDQRRRRPGVVRLSCGAWYDPATSDADALCAHGNANMLTRDRGTSKLAQGPTSATTLVEVERWRGPVPRVRAFEPPEHVAAP